MQKGLVTKSAFKKMTSGHPWLTADDFIDRSHLPKRACAYQLGDHWWLCSPESYIKLRRLGPPQKGWMHSGKFNHLQNGDQFQAYFGNWLRGHLRQTLTHKMQSLDRHANEDLCLRWVFSENDQIPGLIVDIFGSQVVAQLNSAPIEMFWYQIRANLLLAYKDVTNKSCEIIELRNSSVRTKEGLDIIQPEDSQSVAKNLNWNGFCWHMTPAGSQKTGAYFDQRENHRSAASFAKKLNVKTAWDLCCYQGGFALHLLREGLHVTAVDQSQDALTQVHANTKLNALPDENLSTVKADVFSWLEEQAKTKSTVDFIVLDPPSFVKSRTEIAGALRGLKELNTKALQCLNSGGGLVTCVCSHHISEKDFHKTLLESAQLAKKNVEIVQTTGPSPDHSPAPNFPEGRYLQAWYLTVR
jgi:23S rRNA (cytosine1962-C5)-methyltransferase